MLQPVLAVANQKGKQRGQYISVGTGQPITHLSLLNWTRHCGLKQQALKETRNRKCCAENLQNEDK